MSNVFRCELSYGGGSVRHSPGSDMVFILKLGMSETNEGHDVEPCVPGFLE